MPDFGRFGVGEKVRIAYSPYNSKVILRDPDDPDIGMSVVTLGSVGAGTVQVVDASGNQIEDFGQEPLSPNSNNTKIVTTAGTSVPLSATSIPCKLVRVIADKDNIGSVYLGYSTVNSDYFDFKLDAEDGEYILTDNLNKVYIDASDDNQSVYFTYFT